MSLSLCHRCPRRQPSCAGPCPCLETGIDIIEMQVRGCPLGKFAPNPLGAMPPPARIDPDYTPTPTSATEGGCGCKK